MPALPLPLNWRFAPAENRNDVFPSESNFFTDRAMPCPCDGDQWTEFQGRNLGVLQFAAPPGFVFGCYCGNKVAFLALV